MLPRERAARFTPGRRSPSTQAKEQAHVRGKKGGGEGNNFAAEGPRKGCTADLYALSACACRFEVTVS